MPGGSIAGAGTGGHSTNQGLGGAGKSISDQIQADGFGIDYLDPTLWTQDSEVLEAGVSLKSFVFGRGGSILIAPSVEKDYSGNGADAKDDGTGAGTAAGGILIMRFVIPADTYSVTFDANGGTGSMSNQTGSSSAALTSNTLSRSGFTFAGWNTAADGSGTAYADGASYAFNANLTLYAQWTATTPPAPTPYTGPIPVKLDVSCVPSTGGKATLTGERLSGITAATVDGKAVTVSNATSSSVELEFPALAAGTYDIQYVSSNGNITQQGGLRVCATSTTSTPTAPGDSGSSGSGDSDAGNAAPERLYVYKRFTNYLGDRGGVVAADRKAITDFIKANPGLTHVTCVGSTSGVPAIETDPALATARANNACSIVEELIPGVETRIATNVGLGVGQFYRAVTLFGKGTKG